MILGQGLWDAGDMWDFEDLTTSWWKPLYRLRGRQPLSKGWEAKGSEDSKRMTFSQQWKSTKCSLWQAVDDSAVLWWWKVHGSTLHCCLLTKLTQLIQQWTPSEQYQPAAWMVSVSVDMQELLHSWLQLHCRWALKVELGVTIRVRLLITVTSCWHRKLLSIYYQNHSVLCSVLQLLGTVSHTDNHVSNSHRTFMAISCFRQSFFQCLHFLLVVGLVFNVKAVDWLD